MITKAFVGIIYTVEDSEAECRLIFFPSWGLSSRSYDKTSVRPASVLVLVLRIWYWFQH